MASGMLPRGLLSRDIAMAPTLGLSMSVDGVRSQAQGILQNSASARFASGLFASGSLSPMTP